MQGCDVRIKQLQNPFNSKVSVCENPSGGKHTSQISSVRVNEHARNDAPMIKCLAIRAVRPAHARVRVSIEEAAVVELPLRRLYKFVRVGREIGY